MKKLFLTLVYAMFLSQTMGVAQSSVIDSLIQSIDESAKDSTQVDLLLEISQKTFQSDPENSINYSNRAITLSNEINYKKGLGYAYKNIGLAYYIKGDYTEVLKYWKQSLATFEAMNFKLGISNLQNNLGAVYFSKGDDPKALEYYLASLRLAEEIDDKKRIATANVNIGAVYFNDEATWDQSLEAYEKAMKYSQEIDYQDGIGTSAMNLGEMYLKKRDFNSALNYLNIALNSFRNSGSSTSHALNLIGNTYLEKGDLNLALTYGYEAIASAKKIDSKGELLKALVGLGNVYQKQGNHSAAIKEFEKVENIALEIGHNLELRDAYAGLAQSNSSLGKYKLAFAYGEKLGAIKDSIRTQESDKIMGDLRFGFDLENKEKEIALLNKDNAIKEAIIKQDSIFRNFLYALAFLLLSILAGIYYQYRFTKKSNKLLAEERNRAESILLNILPKDTADELKEKGFVEAREFEQTTVLFTDFKGFSKVAEQIPADNLVKSVDYYFRKFDEIIGNHNLEKIKTIGDAYMCAGGLPTPNDTNAKDAYLAAIDLLNFVNETKKNPPEGIQIFDVRIGINTGPVVAGVVGTKKFQYDIWGSTVNIASRMESNSVKGKINVSENTYKLLKDEYEFTYRGEIEVKNVGKMKMYFVGADVKESIMVT